MRNLLAGNGYELEVINDFPVSMEQLKSFQPHLILLDIKLPGSDGFSVCSQIRTFSDVPIIFVTSCNTDMDELNSIMLGGDAFITKPYNTAILLAKTASLLRKTYPVAEQEILSCHGVALHLESGKIEYAGRQTDLTKNELKMLYYLFKHAGTICARADIVEYLWDNESLGKYLFNSDGSVLVFPDIVCDGLHLARTCYYANTETVIPYNICDIIREEISEAFQKRYEYLFTQYEAKYDMDKHIPVL